MLSVCRFTSGWLQQRGGRGLGGGGRHGGCTVLQEILAGKRRVVQSTLLHKGQAMSHFLKQNNVTSSPSQRTSNTFSLSCTKDKQNNISFTKD